MCLDDENRRNHQPWKARLSQISSKSRRLPSRTALSIVLGGHEGYHAARNRGSSGECRLICLGDMPWVEVGVLKALIETFTKTGINVICVPVRNGQRGNPVLWGRIFFSD